MGADTPAVGGETKPVGKNDGKPNNHHGGRNNVNRHDNYIKKEKFLGANPNLRGHVFEAKRNRSEQVANFTNVDNIIKAQIGTECDPFVLESLEKEADTLPSEPLPVTTDDYGSMTDVEKMKYKSKYDKYLTWVDKVEMQLKQIYSKYYGQCDKDMKASLKEDSNFERAH